MVVLMYRRLMGDKFPINLSSRYTKRMIALIVIILIVIYGIIPNLHSFGINFTTPLPKDWQDIFMALIFMFMTFVSSSTSYRFLAFRKLFLAKILLIQSASVPLNLLLPAGIGNISINYLFLRTNGHNRIRAGLVVAFNNIMGVIANITILLTLLALFGISHREARIYSLHKTWTFLVVIALIIFTIVIFWLIRRYHKKVVTTLRQVIRVLASYRRRPWSVVGSYAAAALQAIATGLAFWFCIKAYGISLPYPTAFLIFSLSVAVGAITPTPGGLGGIEASLVAGLVAVHATSTSTALGIVLAYRAISYWLPITIGIFSLYLVNHLKLIHWRNN